MQRILSVSDKTIPLVSHKMIHKHQTAVTFTLWTLNVSARTASVTSSERPWSKHYRDQAEGSTFALKCVWFLPTKWNWPANGRTGLQGNPMETNNFIFLQHRHLQCHCGTRTRRFDTVNKAVQHWTRTYANYSLFPLTQAHPSLDFTNLTSSKDLYIPP